MDAVIARARAGNVYVNRPVTGARVGIEPFGGFALSGTGPKAGGVDYLRAFRIAAAPDPAVAPAAAEVPAAPASLADAPSWMSAQTMARPATRTDGPGQAVWTLMAEVSAITAFAEPVVAQAKRMLRQRRGTHAIPGQRTEEHLRRGRGPMLLIAHADAPL